MASVLREGWEVRKLGDVCDFQGGSQPPKSQFIYELKEGYVRFLQIRDFKNSKNITYIPESNKNRYCNKNDVLLGRYGASVGKVLVNKAGAYNVAVMKTIPNKNILDTRYLFFYLTSADFQTSLLNVAKRSAQDGFSKKDIHSFPILIPSLQEQEKIVAILDEAFSALDKAKENAELNLQNAKELFESYLQGVFENKGEDWEEKQLGEIAVFRNGMTFDKKTLGKETKILGVRDFKNDFFIPHQTLSSVYINKKLKDIDFLEDGDILTVRSNGNPKLIGRTLLAKNTTERTIHSGFTIRIRLNSKVVLPIYLCHYLKTQRTRKILVDGGNGVGIRSLNQGGLSILSIPFPSLQQQKQIVKKLDLLSAQTKKLESIYTQKLQDLEELKKSILQKVFNGELT